MITLVVTGDDIDDTMIMALVMITMMVMMTFEKRQ